MARQKSGKGGASPDNDNTDELLRRARAGDKAALTELFTRDRQWVEAKVRRRTAILRTSERTSDIVQELMMKLLASRKPPLAINQAQLRAYLAEVIHNLLTTKAGKALLALQRLPTVVTIMEHIEDQVAGSRGPEAGLVEAEERDLLERALSLLDGRDQDLIRLRGRELTFAQIGEQLDMTEDHARIEFGRALLRLEAKVRRISQPDWVWPSDGESGHEASAG